MNIEDCSLGTIKNFVRKKFGVYIKKDIPIPENIELDKEGDIIFNKGLQVLFICCGRYNVNSKSRTYNDYSDEFKLVPVSYEDIKIGDTITVEELEDNLHWWYKIDEDKNGWFVNNEMGIEKEANINNFRADLLKVVRR